MLRKSPFILPSVPILAKAPPVGSEWIHELKHDGWRAQLHKAGDDVVVFPRNGNDATSRFKSVAIALATLPLTSCIVDAELVACDAEGQPNFYALMGGAKHGCCAYCFDLLELDGDSLLATPLDERRFLLRRLMRRADRDTLRLSEVFDHPMALLAACEEHGLEGIVSKLREDRYRSGKNPGWIKVKTAAWREANRERHKLFEKT